MNELELLQGVVDETSRVIDHVSDAEMANATPCDGWTVRDVVDGRPARGRSWAVGAATA